MEKVAFTLYYNGKNVACVNEEDRYLVQISYTPLQLQRLVGNDGEVQWIDLASNRVTPLSAEIGWLIQEQFINVEKAEG